MKKFLKNIVKLKTISTIKDFRFGTFPSISGSGLGYTFYPPPFIIPYCTFFYFWLQVQHADVHATACWRIGSYAPEDCSFCPYPLANMATTGHSCF